MSPIRSECETKRYSTGLSEQETTFSRRRVVRYLLPPPPPLMAGWARPAPPALPEARLREFPLSRARPLPPPAPSLLPRCRLGLASASRSLLPLPRLVPGATVLWRTVRVAARRKSATTTTVSGVRGAREGRAPLPPHGAASSPLRPPPAPRRRGVPVAIHLRPCWALPRGRRDRRRRAAEGDGAGAAGPERSPR